MNLARFRADPSRCRVSILRRKSGFFVVTIAELADGGRQVVGAHRVARSAVYRALLAAQAAGLVGVDLGMGSTYPHPQAVGWSPWNAAQGVH